MKGFLGWAATPEQIMRTIRGRPVSCMAQCHLGIAMRGMRTGWRALATANHDAATVPRAWLDSFANEGEGRFGADYDVITIGSVFTHAAAITLGRPRPYRHPPKHDEVLSLQGRCLWIETLGWGGLCTPRTRLEPGLRVSEEVKFREMLARDGLFSAAAYLLGSAATHAEALERHEIFLSVCPEEKHEDEWLRMALKNGERNEDSGILWVPTGSWLEFREDGDLSFSAASLFPEIK